MTPQEKKDKIQKLSKEELVDLLVEVLRNSGYDEPYVDTETVYALKKDSISNQQVCELFYVIDQKMSGIDEPEIIEMCNEITAAQKREAASRVYLVCPHYVSNGFKKVVEKNNPSIGYIEIYALISLVDRTFSSYWEQISLSIARYRDEFISQIQDDSNLRRLPIEKEKYKKMLDFFVSPRLIHLEEDKHAKKISRKTYSVEDVIKYEKPILINGGAGAGKTTLLKQIGKKLIETPVKDGELQPVPVYVTAIDIKEAVYEMKSLIQKKLSTIIAEGGLGDLDGKYIVTVLVDSIDEFDDKQKNIVEQLEKLRKTYSIRYYIGTRNADSMLAKVECPDLYDMDIRKLNYEQIASFVAHFFNGNELKADRLLDALRMNNIIDKLPITPLTLSLISILYNERDYDVPATLTDIYDNFSTLILGRSTVSSKLEFIDVTFKERVLSQYALALLERSDHMPMTQEEFKAYFKEIYEDKSMTLTSGSLDDALDYLVRHTGILILDKEKHVQFAHASYMEYYASVEIFNHSRATNEQLLVDNFYDYNWQNAAIFYAGRTRDMKEFLEKIQQKVQEAGRLPEMYSSVGGCGYLLQALYLTDNKLRGAVIKDCLNLTLEIADVMKKMAADDAAFFRDYKIPILNLFGFLLFYDSYRSVTIKEPLQNAYKELYEKYKLKPSAPLAYNLLALAFTLNSPTIGDDSAMNQMTREALVYNDPSLFMLASFAMDLTTPGQYKSLKKDFMKSLKLLPASKKSLIQQSAAGIRFTDLDSIIPRRKVTLLVEGATDARILEHAYMVLTNGRCPYWRVKQSGDKQHAGCADAVAKAVNNASTFIGDDEVYIGIFDHDAAGLSAYRGQLGIDDYKEEYKDYVKQRADIKHGIDFNIYAIVLPIPEDMQEYNKNKQNLNYFAIEHYFGHKFLTEHDMAHPSEDVNGVYILHDSNKTKFAEEVTKEFDVHTFERFLPLFERIDKIAGIDNSYVI